jgi:uncharacterized protein (TIGR03435 family)
MSRDASIKPYAKRFCPLSKNPLAIRGRNTWTDAADEPPSIFDALPKQLGLRLKAATGPVDTAVIDHIETPSEN